MKGVKIILSIVSVFAFIFFATGLVVKEVNYSVAIEINSPTEEVFTLFTAPETLQKWMPEVTSLDSIDVKEGKVGSTYSMVIENQGQEMHMTQKILAYIPNKKMTFRFNSDQMIKIDDYVFVEKGSKTTLIQNCSVNSKSYITACLFPYFKGTFAAASQQYMEAFKKLAEQ